MKKNITILLIFMTLLANFIFAEDEQVSLSGPDLSVPLEIFGTWDPEIDPIFILSANSQSIDYTKETIQYQTEDFDLSSAGQTETFTISLYSNFSYSNKGYYSSSKVYDIYIYHSNEFVPTDDTLYDENDYPEVDISMNYNLNNYYYSNFDIDYKNRNKNKKLQYSDRSLSAYRYKFQVYVYPGLVMSNIMDFDFSWEGYSRSVEQYWDMEAYVKVEISGS